MQSKRAQSVRRWKDGEELSRAAMPHQEVETPPCVECRGRGASPDLPTPALPKTASFTSGLLAMTAAEVSESFSGVKGQPSMLSAARQQETVLRKHGSVSVW